MAGLPMPPQYLLEDTKEPTVNFINTTNNFIQQNLIDSADLDGIGIDYSEFNSCLADFSCTAPTAQSLRSILRYALTTAPQVAAERARLAATQSTVEGAEWSFWPTPSFELERRQFDNNYQLSVVLQQPLHSGGRLTANLDRVRTEALIQHSQLAVTQLDLALSIVSQYGTWLNAYTSRAQWQEILQVLNTLLDRVDRIRAAGSMSDTEANQAYAIRDNVEAEMLLAEANAESALASLSQMIDTRLNAELMHQNKLMIMEVPSDIDINSKDFLDSVRQVSPSFARAQAEVAAAEAAIKNTQAEIWPQVFLRAEHIRVFGDEDDNRIFIGVNGSTGAGLSLSSNVDAASQGLLAAKTQLLSVERQLRQQLASAQSRYRGNVKREQSLIKLLRSSEKYFDSVNRLFSGSGTSSIDVLEAAQALGEIQTQLTEARTTMFIEGWNFRLLSDGFHALDSDAN